MQRKHAKQHGKEYTSNTPKGKFKFGLSLVETAGVLVIAYVVMRNLGNLLALCLVFYDRWMLILSMASMITYLYRKVYLLSDDPYAPALAFSTAQCSGVSPVGSCTLTEAPAATRHSATLAVLAQ